MLDNDAFAKQGCQITYPIAGAFTKYLIDTFGKEKYLALYKYTEDDYENFFISLLKNTFAEIENAFWQKMRTVDFDSTVLEKMLKAEGF